MDTFEKYQVLYLEMEANRKLADSLMVEAFKLQTKNSEIVCDMAKVFIEAQKQQNDNIKLN